MIAIEAALRSFAQEVKDGARVLDVGCGDRPYESLFGHCRYIGIDVSADRWSSEYARRPDVRYDGTNVPVAAGSVDHVVCTEVLEHCRDPGALLGEIRRVLKGGGTLFLTVPFMWALHNLPFDFRRYTIEGIRGEIERAQFRIRLVDKLTRGRDAVNQIVRSEINAHQQVHPQAWAAMTWSGRLRFAAWRMAWDLQERLGRGLFDYERLYLDNLVIAEKPG